MHHTTAITPPFLLQEEGTTGQAQAQVRVQTGCWGWGVDIVNFRSPKFCTTYCQCIFIPSRTKHPAKDHVWAGISQKGLTEICIFEGKTNAPLFTAILNKTLLPFLRDISSCRTMTRSILLFMPDISWRTKESTGGELPLSLLI